jgi:glutamyl-tRNA synthetase
LPKHGYPFYESKTDQNRFVTGAESYILEARVVLGIAPMKGIETTKIWSRTAKVKRYAIYAEELIKNGWAYYAFDSSEALEQSKKRTKKEYFIYNHNRELLDTSLYYIGRNGVE